MEVQQKPTILVVDEMGLVRDGIGSICERTGTYKIIGYCADGVSALERILAEQPDLTLMGCNVPKLFSLEVVRKARAAAVRTRFILLLARLDRKLALEALRAGASGVVLKASSSTQLLAALSKVSGDGVFVSPELDFAKHFASWKTTAIKDPLDSLSSREYEVFTLLIDGYRAKEIAARLDLSPKTIDSYRASLMRKLDLHDVASLVKYAPRIGGRRLDL
jgi:DNA-binding NarL/FixJ family response regulator